MSYEYNSTSQRFDLPNPYRVQNVLVGVTAAAAFLIGLVLLFVLREKLAGSAHHGGEFLASLVAVLLITAGLAGLAFVAMQLRFFFGRGRPASLAQEIASQAEGEGAHSAELREMLRQNALSYREPHGPIEGLLYSWLPNLLFAPPPLRWAAERQFQNLLVIGVTLLSFLLAWMLGARGVDANWIGVIYGALTIWVLLRRIRSGHAVSANIGLVGVVGLIVAGVLLPVVLHWFVRVLPDVWSERSAINAQVAWILVLALAASALFLRSALIGLVRPPSISMACDQRTVNINAHPAQLTDEIERELQAQWAERIPNRRYVFVAPKIEPNSRSGRFDAEVLEETQPFPSSELEQAAFAALLAEPRTLWTAALSAFGAIIGVGACLCAAAFAASALAPEGLHWQWMTITIGLASVALFAFRGAQFLFGRFDFSSTLIWIEGRGNYQSARLDYGNTLQDRIKTAKDLINIENMTLRVWAADLDTTIFGKLGERYVVGMRGRQDLAKYFAEHLTQFSGSQNMIITPGSAEDLQRAAMLGQMNQVGDLAAPPPPTGLPPLPVLAALTEAHSHEPSCAKCGTRVDENARFCSACGTPVMS